MSITFDQDERPFLVRPEGEENQGPSLSFEFFPPRTKAAAQRFKETSRKLASLSPELMTITYGAGGTTKRETRECAEKLQRSSSAPVAAHITAVGATRDEVDTVARRYWHAGIHRLLALRGDPPRSCGTYRPHPGGYDTAADLVAGLKKIADFEIGVAAYPEVHPDAVSLEADLDNLKRKVDAGASFAVTQFFFDPTIFLRFLERARAHGIWIPIRPGILPIHDLRQVKAFADDCGSTIPKVISDLFSEAGSKDTVDPGLSVLITSEICRFLRERGVETFHFYTLNRAEIVYPVCQMLALNAPGDGATEEFVTRIGTEAGTLEGI